MDVLTGLLHDAPDAVDLEAHRALRRLAHGWAVGPLVVADSRLSTLAAADEGPEVAVSVVSGTGADGLLSLGRRRTGVRVAAVETALRDLDDLAGNAARVVAAAQTLPEGVDVYVELPGGPGLVDALETVEAAGLFGRVDLAAPGLSGVERLSVLVEADLPFKVTGLRPATFGAYGVAALLMAVEALVDGAEADEAAALLAGEDETRMLAGLARWDAAIQSRVQRRLRGVDCTDVRHTLDELRRAGLLEAAG